ncbi:hypothetical protein JCM8547_007260 [Rhodosporidiobolus lusitaniae]
MDDLPPLPPPLPPSHSRSFSSSSSSDAGSPRPSSFKGWGGGAAATMRRSDSASSVNSLGGTGGTVRRGSGAGSTRSASKRGAATAGGHGKSASSGSRTSSTGSPSPTLARTPGLAHTLSAASASSSSSARSTGSHTRGMTRTNSGGGGTFPSSSSRPSISPTSSRPRPSNLLAKVSPSLSTSSRFSSITHSNLSSVGLRATPPLSPASTSQSSGPSAPPADFGLRAFAKGLGQLPSPPHTASDGGSVGGGHRFDTTRSNGTAGTSSSGDSPNKPHRPPKSEARRGSGAASTTPTKKIPTIGRTSPTVAGSPAPARRDRGEAKAVEADELVSPPRRSVLEREFFEEKTGDREEDGQENTSGEAGDISGASTTPTRESSGVVGEPRRRLRARTASSGGGGGSGDELLTGEEAERRRERRSRNASALREKNQRILDSINSLSPSSSSTSLDQVGDLSPPRTHRSSTIRRSSTSSTIRDIAEGQSSLHDEEWQAIAGASSGGSNTATWLDENRRRVRPSPSVDEFGVSSSKASISRSQTLSNLDDDRFGQRDSPLRSRTQGYRSSGHTSLSSFRNGLAGDEDDEQEERLPTRSMTSMSSYPSGGNSFSHRTPRSRRSDLVGSDRTRAASAFGDTSERDKEIAAGMRRLASREVLRSPREREPLPDSPAYARESATASLRNRPALPQEFRSSPSASATSSSSSPSATRSSSRFASTTSSSSRPSLDLNYGSNEMEVLASTTSSPSLVTRTSSPRFTNSSATSPSLSSPRDRLQSPRLTTTARGPSPLSTPDSADRRRWSRSESLDGQEAFDSPRTKKSSNGSGGSGDIRRRLENEARRTQSISEVIERPYSRQASNGPRENGSNGTLTPPPSSSSRFSDIAADLQARKERLRSVEVGSEAWIAEFEDIRRRARSRQSGSSGDARSSVDLNGNGTSQADRDRDRIVRAINALLAGQGIVASVVGNPTSPTASSSTSSPRKRQSFANFDTSERPRRISFADGTHQDAPAPPGSTLLTRTNSSGSRVESSLGGLISNGNAAVGDHHKLLLSAFDRFDQHFSTALASDSSTESKESAELVKRMHALIASTTKLNLGLKALVDAIRDEQIQAQLDEEERNPTISVVQFEKSVNALLRSSDDQVRNLTEDLIAFTRVERERDRLRRSGNDAAGEGSSSSYSRPVSRASGYGSLHSPPKRAATSSPYEGASVSLASARSPVFGNLRNPLVEDDDPSSSANHRHTLSYAAGRSPFASNSNGSASPTPASGRRESAHVRSPLAKETGFETPSQRQSNVSSSASMSGAIGLGLPLPTRPPSASTLRSGKTSDNSTVRAGSPPPHSSTIRFPTTRALPTSLDSTPAISNSSPTRSSRSPRSYSEADRLALESALEMGANQDEQEDVAAGFSPPLHTASARESLSRSASPEVELGSITGSGGGRRPRLSTGAIGTALKNVLTRPRRGTNDLLSNQTTSPVAARSSFDSTTTSSSPELERRTERRKEVEDILRRTASQRS